MKKHNLFKVVMITIAVTVLLTWLLPETYYNNQGLVEAEREQVGIFTLMSYVGIAIQYFSHIDIYVLSVGGLYGVLHNISGYRNLIDKVTKGFKGREWLFMSIVMVIFAICSSMAGMSLPLIFMFPFVISVILAMGYDKITAALVTVGSVSVGLIGSVFSANDTYGIDIVLGTAANKDVWLKIIVLVVCLALLIFNTLRYASKNKVNEVKALTNAGYIPESKDKNEKYWPVVVIMDLVFIILILAFISWSLFNITWFDKLFKNITTYKIGGFAIFGKILGLSNAFGSWTLNEASIIIIIASLLLSFIYGIKFDQYVKGFMDGGKRALKAAVLAILVYVVLVIVTYVPVMLTIFKPILELTKSLNVFTMSLVSLISSTFFVELYYAATNVLPYATGVLYTTLNTSEITIISVIFQSMYGLATLIAPTSVILLVTLSYLHIPYGKWLKSNWKLIVELLVLLLAIFLILTLI